MSNTNKQTGAAVQVLEGEHTLPQETPFQLFSEEELQMPSFIRGDEDEDAEDLFYLSSQPTTPA